MEVKCKTVQTDTSSAISAALEGSWSGVGKSVSGSAAFKHELAESKDISSSTVEIRMSG